MDFFLFSKLIYMQVDLFASMINGVLVTTKIVVKRWVRIEQGSIQFDSTR